MGSSPTPGTNPFRITEKLTMSKNIADREPKNKTKKQPAKKEVETSKFMWASTEAGHIQAVWDTRNEARQYGVAKKVLVTLV